MCVQCTNLDGLNAEDKFQVWVTLPYLAFTSPFFIFNDTYKTLLQKFRAVKVHDSTIRKDDKYGMFGRVASRKPLLSKKNTA